MICDVDVQWVILGHSERRTIFKETNEVRLSMENIEIANLIMNLIYVYTCDVCVNSYCAVGG